MELNLLRIHKASTQESAMLAFAPESVKRPDPTFLGHVHSRCSRIYSSHQVRPAPSIYILTHNPYWGFSCFV